MSLEQQVIALTEATEQLLEAANTRKADLDTAETNASLSAQIAATSAADRVQTGLDRIATGEDRVQAGLGCDAHRAGSIGLCRRVA